MRQNTEKNELYQIAVDLKVKLANASPLTSCFFLNDTATTEIYTLSLHDALPISPRRGRFGRVMEFGGTRRNHHGQPDRGQEGEDRKSTRLNSSHDQISYAVF